jgi:hypothetical protein
VQPRSGGEPLELLKELVRLNADVALWAGVSAERLVECGHMWLYLTDDFRGYSRAQKQLEPLHSAD